MCVSVPLFEGLLQRVCAPVSSPRATPLSSNARLLQGLLQCVCASVSWPCMCVSARFEGLLQRVCVSQQSSCSSSHGPPFSPPASPPLTALAWRESAQSTRPASPGKTHALGGCGRTGSTGVPPGKQLSQVLSRAERNQSKFDLLLLLIVTQPQNTAAVITCEHSSLTGEHRGTSV